MIANENIDCGFKTCASAPAAEAMGRLARDVDVQHEVFAQFGVGLTAEPDS